jgi:ubiquinone/menaquinone biosynthesis C-methylase UbiE
MFTNDFELNRGSPRYVKGQLPALDFRDSTFDLALCSHFLFLYSEHFDAMFHLAAIIELLRVANEVRIFPILTLTLEPSPHLPFVTSELQATGFRVDIRRVEYELQKGGNEMLVIKRTGQQGSQPDVFGAD